GVSLRNTSPPAEPRRAPDRIRCARADRHFDAHWHGHRYQHPSTGAGRRRHRDLAVAAGRAGCGDGCLWPLPCPAAAAGNVYAALREGDVPFLQQDRHRGPDRSHAPPERRAASGGRRTETVTVVGSPPVVDVGSSTVGTALNQDFVARSSKATPPSPSAA